MNNNFRIAITQGNANGVATEMILRAFAEPEMAELCPSLVVGSEKMLSLMAKSLDLRVPMSLCDESGRCKPSTLGVVNIAEAEHAVEAGKDSVDAKQAALSAEKAALSDAVRAMADATLLMPSQTAVATIERQTLSMALMPHRQTRVTAFDGSLMLGNKAVLKDTLMVGVVKQMATMLKRHFRLGNPRILLAIHADESIVSLEQLQLVAEEAAKEGIQVFAKTVDSHFYTSPEAAAYDLIMTADAMQTVQLLRDSYADNIILVAVGDDNIQATPLVDNFMRQRDGEEMDITPLTATAYTLFDMLRSRRDYDDAYRDPLPKLYKEGPDRGERIYCGPAREKTERPRRDNANMQQTEKKEADHGQQTSGHKETI